MNPISPLNQTPKTSEQAELAQLGSKLAFSRKLQTVANKIHAARNIDAIMLEIGVEICNLLEADRVTIYSVSDDASCIVSRVKTGLSGFKDISLRISPTSIAGYAAMHKTVLNIADVSDAQALARLDPELRFLRDVDEKTGYQTRQLLVAPILNESNELLGVVQLVNTLSGLPFPAAAEEGIEEVARTLAIAFDVRRNLRPAITGKFDYLVRQKLISADEITLAIRAARKKGKHLEDVLVDQFQIKVADLGKALSEFYQVPYEPFNPQRAKPVELFKNLKQEFVQSSLWVPLEETPQGLVVLTPDPDRVKNSRIAANVFPKHTLIYKVCMYREFMQTLNLFFGDTGASIDDLLSNLEEEGEELLEDDDLAAIDNELVKLVNKIIVDAFNQGASDIHVESGVGKDVTNIRFRRDGSLVPYIEVPASYRNALVARLKIMCDLDIAERRKPQDGKIKFKKFGGLDIELRVATIPTAGGVEDVVLRILASGEPIPLDKLGLSPRNTTTIQNIISKPYGLFLVCGPTGSGKTTTLHSVLKCLNTPETKIWTAEDPVEITQKGLRQVQVNPKAGLTFAMAMRAFLRADPDVIMVGEMRDEETVRTGIEASLTGHLVLATLHTNSAPESIIRLLDMGMDPFNFSDALLGVLAQRLAKRLCPQCKKPHVASGDEIKALLQEYCAEMMLLDHWKQNPKAMMEATYQEWLKQFGNEQKQLVLYEAAGCEACHQTGYKGRLGLHELLVGSDAMKKHIQSHARVAEMLVTALQEGMRTLKQDGIERVLQGTTDMKQVRAVCIK